MAAAGGCLRSVGLQFWAGSLPALPALLAPAVLLGLLLGAATAALLCRCALGPRRRAQKDDSQRLLESFNSDEKEHTFAKNRAEPYTSKEEMVLEESESPLDSNITAFALKAKVIYPINQKFRPLADGSSNPSLHENPKQAVLPNQVVETSTSGSLGSLSQGDKEDCSSSTTIHSTTSDDRFQARAFLKVTSFPEVLTCESFDVKLCLCSLVLRDLMHLDTELRKEKHVMFIQVLKIYLTDFYREKTITDDLFKKILLIQENDFEELQKQLDCRLQNTETSGAHNSEYQTLEDLERKEREYSEHVIDNMEAFWKQTDKAQQAFLDQSKCSSAKTTKIMMDLTEKMIAVESLLSESQDLRAMDIQERLFNWELMVKMIDSLKSYIPEECKGRLIIVSNILDHLTVKNNLSVRQKEELLTDLHKAFWEQLAHFSNECMQQSKDLILKRLECRAKKKEEFKHRQEAEQESLLSKTFLNEDVHNFLKAYHELIEKHQQAQWELEEEDDCESTEAVASLYKELYSKASHALEELVTELFLQTLPVVTGLSVRECELLKEEWQENLVPQLEKWETHRQQRWKLFQEQLSQEKELWTMEYALSAVMQKHLSEKQEKIIQGVVSRLGCLSDESVNYILQKHRLLLCSVLRRLSLRRAGMAALARMRLSRKKSLLQELSEQHTLQKGSSPCQDEDQWQLQKAVESHIREEEEKLEEETQETNLEFHQQLVTEIQEALQFLQQHMEQVIGQTLLQHAQQEAGKKSSDDGQDFKERLVEAAVESVYGTSNNINRLVQNYYQQLGKITEGYEEKKIQQLKSLQAERNEKIRLKKKQENELALKEKHTKGFLNVSSAVHQRIMLQQKKVLSQFELQQQTRLESLKQKLLALHHLETELENQLREAEQDFVSELAVLTRVPVAVKKKSSKRSKPAGEKIKSRKQTFHSPQSAEKDDSHENIQEPHGLTSDSCREMLQSPHEGETEPRKNSNMLKKKGSK
ncbi:ellis-van Creveld syndrome protein isoform X1 [Neopelma chrysocephalum]|uniref:ellis-van Creveld syndrome protein isoform X1 n=1 Tax=Neopelma chrysocephalum TaxID=114329 RepID=UPI000FCCF16E|nr:ellis-van Creveld syndrome protein isoform X1 [Neopelma chrysocephalum]